MKHAKTNNYNHFIRVINIDVKYSQIKEICTDQIEILMSTLLNKIKQNSLVDTIQTISMISILIHIKQIPLLSENSNNLYCH